MDCTSVSCGKASCEAGSLSAHPSGRAAVSERPDPSMIVAVPSFRGGSCVHAEVVGVDLSPAMLRRAERRRRLSPANVTLMEMNVAHLEFPDASFDAAVASFLFCVLPDELQLAALQELGRVVKPKGTIRLLEYTRPHGRIRRGMTKLCEPWVRWAYGASFDRRTEQLISDAGLTPVGARYVV